MENVKRLIRKAYKELLGMKGVFIEDIPHPFSGDLGAIRVNNSFAVLEQTPPTLKPPSLDNIEGEEWKKDEEEIEPEYTIIIKDIAPSPSLLGQIDPALSLSLFEVISFMLQYELTTKIDKFGQDNNIIKEDP